MGAGESKIGNFSFSDALQCMLQEQAILGDVLEWVHSSKSVSIFLTGKTGSGKSTLVNAIVGEDVAKEGDEPDPMTAEVTCHPLTRDGITLKVWDSPGLQDGTGQEERYIQDMKTKCKEVDLYLLCINIYDSPRFNRASPEIQAIKKLTEAFGPSMWENAAIALTFANRIAEKNQPMTEAQANIKRAENRISLLERQGMKDSDEMKEAEKKRDEEKTELENLFSDKIREWDEGIRQLLKTEVNLDPERVDAVEIVPAGYREPLSLPDRPYWLSTFWFSVLSSTHRRAQPALLHLNRKRIVESPEQVSERDVDKHLHDQLVIFTEKGAEAGGAWGSAGRGLLVGLKIARSEAIGLLEGIMVERFSKLALESRKELPEIKGSQPEIEGSQPEIERSQCESGGGPA